MLIQILTNFDARRKASKAAVTCFHTSNMLVFLPNRKKVPYDPAGLEASLACVQQVLHPQNPEAITSADARGGVRAARGRRPAPDAPSAFLPRAGPHGSARGPCMLLAWPPSPRS